MPPLMMTQSALVTSRTMSHTKLPAFVSLDRTLVLCASSGYSVNPITFACSRTSSAVASSQIAFMAASSGMLLPRARHHDARPK